MNASEAREMALKREAELKAKQLIASEKAKKLAEQLALLEEQKIQKKIIEVEKGIRGSIALAASTSKFSYSYLLDYSSNGYISDYDLGVAKRIGNEVSAKLIADEYRAVVSVENDTVMTGVDEWRNDTKIFLKVSW